MMGRVRLYHFTNAWLGIVCSNAIDPAFSLWDDGTLPLIHLTASMYIQSLPDTHQNRRYRITVDVDDARSWVEWAGTNLTAAAATVLTGPGFGGDPRLWIVVSRSVPQEEWIETCTRIGRGWTRIWPPG
jgi:hypothetical protein